MVYRSILCSMLMMSASGALSMEPSGQPVSEITSGKAVRTIESMRKIIAEYVNPYPRIRLESQVEITLPHIPIDLKPATGTTYVISFFDQYNRQKQTIPFKLKTESLNTGIVGLGIINLSRGTSRVTPVECSYYHRFGKGKYLSLFIGPCAKRVYAFDHRDGQVWSLSSSLPATIKKFDENYAQILDDQENEIVLGLLPNIKHFHERHVINSPEDLATRLCLCLKKDAEGTIIVHDNTSIVSQPSLASLPWEYLERRAIYHLKNDVNEDEKINILPPSVRCSIFSPPHLDCKLVKYGSDVWFINKYGQAKKLPPQDPWSLSLSLSPLAEADGDVRYCRRNDTLYNIKNDTCIERPADDAQILGPTFAADKHAVYILPNVEELSDEEVRYAYHLILEGLEPLQQYIIAVIKKKHPLAEKIKIDLRTFEPIANS